MARNQQELPFPDVPTWGGRRKGAGRRRSGTLPRVAHRVRPFHDRHHPVHVTWRVGPRVPSLRGLKLARAIGRTIASVNASHARRGTTFRVVHFSIQPNHLHLLVEGGSRRTLTRGLQGLGIWIARRVNEVRGGHGRVLADRYHERALESPLEVRRALVSVLQNHLHHEPSRFVIDECSSGRWFKGWAEPIPKADTPSPVRRARTWLLATGWRRHGAIAFDERPAG